MKKGRLFIFVFMIIMFFLALYLLFKSFSYTESNKIQENIKSDNAEMNSLFRLTESELENAVMINVSVGDVISYGSGSYFYSIKVIDIDNSNSNVDFSLNGQKFFSVKKMEKKRLDLDSDDYFDTQVFVESINNESVELSIKSINEQKDIPQLIDTRIDEVFRTFEVKYRIQINILILLLLIFIVFITYYIIKFHVIANRCTRSLQKNENKLTKIKKK